MDKVAQQNKLAWEYSAYDFWVSQVGEPAVRAREDRANPRAMLKNYAKFFENVSGVKIANVCGSCGKKAVPLALLGAQVTVFDISDENRRYACETAEAAGVPLTYVVGDVMDIDLAVYGGAFDIVFMEGGILHYFPDLNHFMHLMNGILNANGRMICSDFHPVHKFVDANGLGWDCTDYFSTEIAACEMAHARFYEEEKRRLMPMCLIRRYTLGEIITSVADSGFIIRRLEEYPGWVNPKLPGEFTLVADKTI